MWLADQGAEVIKVETLGSAMRAKLLGSAQPTSYAIHAGGRTILDAVERWLGLPGDALDASRSTLRDCGNMSSATLIHTLAAVMSDRPDSGLALAFGPGLAAEGLRYGWTD